MSTEELLKPRYKLIADYPHRIYDIGSILFVEADGELYSKEQGYTQSIYKVMEDEAKKTPNIFRELEWWEEREPDEMPKYLKSLSTGGVLRYTHGRIYAWENVFPATEAEYAEYKNRFRGCDI